VLPAPVIKNGSARRPRYAASRERRRLRPGGDAVVRTLSNGFPSDHIYNGLGEMTSPDRLLERVFGEILQSIPTRCAAQRSSWPLPQLCLTSIGQRFTRATAITASPVYSRSGHAAPRAQRRTGRCGLAARRDLRRAARYARVGKHQRPRLRDCPPPDQLPRRGTPINSRGQPLTSPRRAFGQYDTDPNGDALTAALTASCAWHASLNLMALMYTPVRIQARIACLTGHDANSPVSGNVTSRSLPQHAPGRLMTS